MLNDCMNFLLSVSQHKVFKYYSKLLEEADLTPAQAGILNCVFEQEKITPKEIGQLLVLEAPTVSGILNKMQAQGLITRMTDETNRRIVWVEATAKGKALQHEIEKAMATLNQEVLKEFTPIEQKTIKVLLAKLIQADF